MEAECPEKPENKAIIEAEKRAAEKERRRAERRARNEERDRDMKFRSTKKSWKFEQYYFRSKSPECVRQKDAIAEDDTGRLSDECGQRTVFVMQLHPKIKALDLYEFFSAVGKVNEVKIIYDKFSKKSRGIAYIEFRNIDAIPIAMSLSGQKLLNHPILVQPSNAERNKIVESAPRYAKATVVLDPVLDVGNIHPDITDEMLQKVFEPFGLIQKCEISREIHTKRSKGFGQILFASHEAAKKAKEALNGFELAGKALKVTSIEDFKNDLTIEEARKKRREMGVHDYRGGPGYFGHLLVLWNSKNSLKIAHFMDQIGFLGPKID